MEAYAIPIRAALVIFPVLALLLTLPYMIYSYRKYGAVSPLRSFVLFSFLFYLMSAYFLVILPLPNPADVAKLQTPTMELIPFTFVKSFLVDSPFLLSNPSTYLPALTSHAFLEPAFNIILTLPFGVYLSYYFRENLPKTVLAAFMLSLFFELTQLTGLYGIYPRPYRLFSVDDLMLNTLGGIFGYYLGAGVRHILPSKRKLDVNSYNRSLKVSYMRRLTADAVDLFILILLTPVVALATGPGAYIFPILFMLYFVGLQALTKGRSVGKLLVRIQVEATARRFPLVVWLLIRYLLVLGPIWAIERFWVLSANKRPAEVWILFIAIVTLLLLYFISWFIGFFKQKRLWYEYISQTRLASTFRLKREGEPTASASPS